MSAIQSEPGRRLEPEGDDPRDHVVESELPPRGDRSRNTTIVAIQAPPSHNMASFLSRLENLPVEVDAPLAVSTRDHEVLEVRHGAADAVAARTGIGMSAAHFPNASVMSRSVSACTIPATGVRPPFFTFVAVRALAPKPMPSAIPAPMAMTFFTAPPNCTPIKSGLV